MYVCMDVGFRNTVAWNEFLIQKIFRKFRNYLAARRFVSGVVGVGGFIAALIGLAVAALAGGGSRGCGPSASPTTVTATGRFSVAIRSVLSLRDVEPARLNIPDKRPRKSFLLARISLATLISESDP
uniref:Uncharacterized protein n=1 Tax=Ceratitis capitata TaxID=7213 RepID=W8ADF2_CERCA